MRETITSPGLVLHLHGPFGAEDASGRQIDDLSRRAQALLAVLSQARGMRAERGWLADLLWSDRSEEQARASLRQELSKLRKSLPDGVLDTNRQHIWLDAERVRVGGAGGGFLEGFDLGSEGFEDWLREMRAGAPATSAAEPRADSPEIFRRPAVLLFAFEALSSGVDDRMIADGLADDLRTTLSYWRWFPVIGPEAIGWKTAKDVDMREAVAMLGAAYAVTGSLRCLQNRVRISVSLNETASGRSLWSKSFEGTLEDIFDFQDEVSRAIVGQLEPQLARAEAMRIARARPRSAAPWQLCAQADEIDRMSGEGYGTPEANFEQARLMEAALEIDPTYADALARLARIFFRAGLLGWLDDRAAVYRRSLDYAQRALDIDRENWQAHAYKALIGISGIQDYAMGRFHSAEAVRLNPSAALAQQAAGCALEWIGEPERALGYLHRVFELNPYFSGRATTLGDITTCEMFLGNRDAAIDAAERLQAIAPEYARGLQRCVATFGTFGEMARATQALERVRVLQPDFDETYVRETYPYARPQDIEMLLAGLRKAGAFAA